MTTKRSSGILMHPTSLPGDFGIGDFGPHAYSFVDFLVRAGQRLWQILPLGPCGKGYSPYMTYGSSAGNPLLIAPDLLLDQGLLVDTDLDNKPDFPSTHIDYPTVAFWKDQVLRKACARFSRLPATPIKIEHQGFCRGNAHWLEDYALFMALQNANEGSSWTQWPEALRRREPDELARFRQDFKSEIEFHKFVQFQFFRQWFSLKRYANTLGIRIIGDLPIYVAHASADVWAHQSAFQLDPATGEPIQVAGVPPDYFSATGQLWGNPVYDWEFLQRSGFSWWIERVQQATTYYDLVRLDHFRGLAAYWSISAQQSTAAAGHWVKAPGRALLEALRSELGHLPFIAEDLGEITHDVIALRDRFGLPGMKVLQFAFSGSADNSFLPIHHVRNCVVYTGTHDNNTSLGWLKTDVSAAEKAYLDRYLGNTDRHEFVWDFIRLALSSVADMAIIPLQDVLELDGDHRMNTPSIPTGNWIWRFAAPDLAENRSEKLLQLVNDYGRH